LAKILKRLCQELEISVAFSADEITKMHETLALEKNQVDIMLQTLSFILQQAAYHLVKPALLAEHLKAFGLDDSSSTILSEVWSNQAKSIVDRLKKESVVPNKVIHWQFFTSNFGIIYVLVQVENVESSLHLQLSSLVDGQTKTPMALIHLNFGQPAEAFGDLTLEFNQTELQKFYQTLETIQAHLDQII
jgi:COMM domain containing 10